jgi:toxin-antitoxin system PIN domain toxin
VIICDVNVLLYAMRVDSPHHGSYGPWLEDALQGNETVGVSELVLSSVIRLATNHRVFLVPSSVEEALTFCEAVLAAPAAIPVRPGERHWSIFTRLLRDAGVRANGVPDVYLAALAIENGATWASHDRGFARFAGLKLLDPARA